MEVRSCEKKRIPADQQLQLIIECRHSCLSDNQWCQEYDINLGTFFNWVKRHRPIVNETNPDVIALKAHSAPMTKQEVVRIDLGQLSRGLYEDPELPVMETVWVSAVSDPDQSFSCNHALKIMINDAVIRITNDDSPGLLA